MNLCCKILGRGSLDVKKLENIINEYEIGIDEVIEEVKINCFDTFDVNSYIYNALLIASNKIKDKLISWLETNQIYDFIALELNLDPNEKIYDYEPRIYVNYIDSGFDDDGFANFNYNEPTEDDYWRLIEEIFSITKSEFKQWLKEQENERYWKNTNKRNSIQRQ